MKEVLFVSKPLLPPWHDSSKNLARDVALGLKRHQPIVMGRHGAANDLGFDRMEPIYPALAADAPAFALGRGAQLRVLWRLCAGRRSDLWHFFFAPNPKSAAAAQFARALRRTASVQTICSAPHPDQDVQRSLFADASVVLSAHTYQRFVAAGIAPDRLRRIPPCVPAMQTPSAEQIRALKRELGVTEQGAVIVYPGDLEFGRGAAITVEAFSQLGRADAQLVMACRAKTPGAAQREQDLRAQLRTAGLEQRVQWAGETPRIHDYLALADLIALPSDTLYAKMDYPLVVLEAMALGRPTIVGEGTPAAELAALGGVHAVATEADAVRAAIIALLDDSSRTAKLGDRARELIRTEFSPAQIADAYESLYEELI